MTARIPLAEQKAKLDRLLDERIALYVRAVRKGRQPAEWGIAKQAECEAIRRSFQFMIDNADWIRTEAQRRASLARDLAELEHQPAVVAFQAAFPDAVVTDVRPSPPAGAPV